MTTYPPSRPSRAVPGGLTAILHASHIRLGIVSANCAECWATATPDSRPAWVRRLADNAKVLG